MLFAVLVYTAVRPPLKFLISYLSLTLLYLGIPVLGLMCGHKTPAHEFLASFLTGNFFYFSALYLKLVPENIVSPGIRNLISNGAGLLYLGAYFYAMFFYGYYLANGGILEGDSMIVTPLTAISMSAGSIKFVSESRNGGKIFDLDILDNLPQKLNPDRNSLIVIHLMGSHTKYRDRYPQEFSKFTGEADIINEYDNSIGYTDYVIDRLFRRLAENTNLMFIGYVSDHGADPSQMGNDHNTTHFVFDMVRIPFVIGFSEKYLKARGDLVNTLSARTGECFTNDLIFDLMLGITGLSSANYYHKSYDLSSESYSVNCGNALTLLGTKLVSEDPGLTGNME